MVVLAIDLQGTLIPTAFQNGFHWGSSEVGWLKRCAFE